MFRVLFQDGHCVPASQQKQNPSIKALHNPSLMRVDGCPPASHMPATFLQQKFHHGSVAESGSVTKKTVQDPEMENPQKNRKQNKNKTENRREQLPRISYEAQQI